MSIEKRIASEEYVIDKFNEKFEASADFVITSDGNTSGLFSYMGFYKVSDEVPTMEDFEKGFTVKWAHATEPQAYTVSDLAVNDMFWAGSTAIGFITGSWFMVMLQDTTSPDGVTTVPKGTYFMATTSIAHELKINPKECIKLECIPDTIARVSDTPSIGGAGLPPVTAADNGKILMVVDGVWQAVALPNAEEASF